MKRLLILFSVLVFCFSCSGIKEDIENLQDRVESIESQLQALKTAYDNGKIIKDVKPYSDAEKSGWTITFSDNQSINIYDGADGITPQLAIDAQGYWEISYDNGATFSRILDGEGAPIVSKGKDGVSVRVVVDENGKYVIESYDPAAAETVIEKLETPYSSDPAACISSITKDEYSGTIKLVMGGGAEYLFNLDVNWPTSIVILAENLVLSKNGTAKFQFRVNPSNAVVDLNIDQENPMVQLDMAMENMTRASYVATSENYMLEKIESVTDADGNVKEGQYIATVTDLGVSAEYCEGAAIVINTKDGKGNKIQISSDLFKIKTPDKPQFITFSINGSYAATLDKKFITVQLPYGTNVTALKPEFIVSEGVVTTNDVEVVSGTPTNFSSPVEYTITTYDGKQESYIVSISYSNIPVVYINTKNAAAITSKTKWLEETDIYVTNAGDDDAHYSKSSIRGRGNTTWGYPKKPYAIKLDSKESVLGMPKHKRWVLLANYVDKTCIRNSVAFEIARRSSALQWTPRGQHVDVVLNGVFMGNYYLCEQIKIDKNRVNITEMESSDIALETINGGYLLEIDKNFDEVNKFYSPLRNMPFMVKEPDEETLTAEQYSWIYNHIAEIENALYGAGSTSEGYLKYIDVESFVDYWLVYELSSTGEPTHPKSVYMYKDRDGKMHAGPVWDFDYFTFQPYYNNMLINTNAVWNDRIINDPATSPVILKRWNESREKYADIAQEIDRQYESIRESAEYNATLWPLNLNVNRDDAMSVKDAVARMKGYYQTKFSWMDSMYKY